MTVDTQFVATLALIGGLLLSGAALYLMMEINRLIEKEYELEINKRMLQKNQEMIRVLRSHRHDFQNHLQVIMGLVQLGRNEGAVSYIKEVVQSFRESSSPVNIKNIDLAALFISKQQQAEDRGIRLELELRSDLGGLVVPAADISRILGNLVDNAFDAVEELDDPAERLVKVSFQEDEAHFIISVLNERPLIPETIQDKIFQAGFSTKGVRGTGLGLAIVQELTEKHGGSVHLVSNAETGTVFTLKFPKALPLEAVL
ncbi:MAG TPA: GHKL domain-containing protein [Clostridia bacterium]|nr:GHKL domain-containing protein [Clostridia bacterium]